MAIDPSSIFSVLSNAGPYGILVALLIWKDYRGELARGKAQEAALAEKSLQEERRIAYDRERLEADKALAASLAALTSAIQSRNRG